MTQFLNRLSLWHKIVGLISVLLFAMLLVAGYSHVKTLQSHDEIQDLNGLLLPILKRLARIEVHALRQDIHYERAMALRSDGKAKALQTETERFKSLGEQVIKEVGTVRGLAAQALERVRDVEDAVELARIEPLLQGIEKAHKRFRAQSLAVLSHTGSTDGELYRTKLAQLEREKDDLFESLALMVLQLEDFVAAQALEVVRHDQERTMLSWQLLTVTLCAFLIGIVLGTIVTRRMLEPIASLKESAAAVAKGDLDIEVEPRTRDEIGELALAFNQMVVGLRERESIKETFSSYVDPRIVGHLLSPGNEDQEGDRREMTVFFSDIEGFTSISEQLTPQSLVKLINHYLADMSVPIQEQDGVIDKFIGDAIMAYWGPPFVRDQDQALLGCRAGLACLEKLPLFQEQVPEITGLRRDAPTVRVRIGLATGPVLIGNIGSRKIRNYTLMGDTVNLAARLEGACKEYGVRMLVSEATAAAVGEEIALREIDSIAVKGKTEPSRIFEPLGRIADAEPATRVLKESFEVGLAAYRAQDWTKANSAFAKCLKTVPDDRASQTFLARIESLKGTPPGTDWDGVWRMTSK
ncbi:MAG: adenylate/guanylate cyclase domain-containing protein [Methyloligellaceae bacterium]